MAQSGIVILKQGREKSARNFHPWVFSGAIDPVRTNVEGVEPGDIVEVRDFRGGYVGRGYFNLNSAIRVRLMTWTQTDALGPAWWRLRLARAIAARQTLAEDETTTAYRLVNAENDGMPGLVVDRYNDFLVLQALTMGVERRKEHIVKALVDLLKPSGIYERSDVDVRAKEGLQETSGVLWGESPPNPIMVLENGTQYPVDIHSGHKTGFYIDQRDSRQWVLSSPDIRGKSVLNCFSYTGGFGACAALNGAESIVNVDSSEPALEVSREVMRLNGVADTAAEFVNGDVFEVLRSYRDEERDFDVIILDPPKFAHTRKQVDTAARGYKDINLLAFQLLRPGGLLLTFSCSGHIDADLFQKIVFGASTDAGVQAQILKWFTQPADHPVMLSFPEGRYLKGLLCRVAG